MFAHKIIMRENKANTKKRKRNFSPFSSPCTWCIRESLSIFFPSLTGLPVALCQPGAPVHSQPVFVGQDWLHREGRSHSSVLLFWSYSRGHVPFPGSVRQKPAFISKLIYTFSMTFAVWQEQQGGYGWRRRAAIKNTAQRWCWPLISSQSLSCFLTV